MDTAGTPLRDLVLYLRTLGPLMHETIERRRDWLHEVGPLIDDAPRLDASTVGKRGDALGRQMGPVFRAAHTTLGALKVPPECQGLHESVIRWLDQHLAACDVLVQIGVTRDPRHLREVQQKLADARGHVARFNEEYQRVRVDVRQRVEALRSGGRANRRRRRGGRRFRLPRFFGARVR